MFDFKIKKYNRQPHFCTMLRYTSVAIALQAKT